MHYFCLKIENMTYDPMIIFLLNITISLRVSLAVNLSYSIMLKFRNRSNILLYYADDRINFIGDDNVSLVPNESDVLHYKFMNSGDT